MSGTYGKIKTLLFICGFLFLPLFVFANPVNLQILGLSNTNPSPGTNVSVTVRFCDDTAWSVNRIRIMAAIISGGAATSFSPCPTAGQFMVVDSNIAGNIASTAGSYDVGSGGTGVGNTVYPSYSNGASPSCPSGSVTA